ncbi:MAG: hypothetical protein WKF71_21045 [Pyrinomonadaceae bacterium]
MLHTTANSNSPTNKKQSKDVLLTKFPQTVEAEKIVMYRLRRFDYYTKDRKIDELKKAEYIKELRAFINRPQHFNKNYVGEIYNNLIGALQKDQKRFRRRILETS